MIMLLNCKCRSEYQDQRYNGKRVCNKMHGKINEFRCTVCGYSVKGKEEEKKKGK